MYFSTFELDLYDQYYVKKATLNTTPSWLTHFFFMLFGFWIGIVDDIIVSFSVSGNLNGVKLDSGSWNENGKGN